MTTVLPLVETIDVSFRHVGRTDPAIAGVNLSLYPGEIVLMAGATGSGKSTLLNCLAGIAPMHTGGTLTGSIRYQGQDICSWTVQQRSRYFCTLLQNVEIQIFTERVWEEISFGLENWNVAAEQIADRITQVLSEFGLSEQRHWQIQQLSAGQKQRLLLGCLLAINQPVLLLDEPLAYLDVNAVDQLLQLLRKRADQGQAILLVEHRLDAVEAICDRAYFVESGRVIEGWQPRPKPMLEKPSLQIPATKTPILQTHQLSWGGYSPFPDLNLVAGETVFLKGDNGSGKTTFLKLLSGLLKPTTGSIEILGQVATAWSVIQRARHIGFVLQNPNHQLFADSVYAEILQPGVSPEMARSLLEKLNLSHCVDIHPQALSQGQKRRLALGAVLVRQPQICLLDEIMVGQDPESLSWMLTVLYEFTQQGGGLILVSHDPLATGVLPARFIEF